MSEGMVAFSAGFPLWLPSSPLYTPYYTEAPCHWDIEQSYCWKIKKKKRKNRGYPKQDIWASRPPSVTDLGYMAEHLISLLALVSHIGKIRRVPVIFPVMLTFCDSNWGDLNYEKGNHHTEFICCVATLWLRSLFSHKHLFCFSEVKMALGWEGSLGKSEDSRSHLCLGKQHWVERSFSEAEA